jgi:GT2 family glycosyltransferase
VVEPAPLLLNSVAASAASRAHMSAAIVDLELSDRFVDAGGLDRYTSAYVVLRLDGVPVGHAWVPVRSCRLDWEELSKCAAAAVAPFSRVWVEHQLGRNPPGASPLPTATVAICTRDRAGELTRSLSAAVAAAGGRPVMVIDNCPSTGATQEVVSRWPAVRYVREDIPGLNAARNRALREATTDVVAFTDDDAVPEAKWLEALLRNFDHRLVLATTGLTLPLELETPAQVWFERFTPFGRGYFRQVFDPLYCSPHSAGLVGAGANMALRRSALDLVGPFDERLDAGTPTRSGGDHEMFSRILSRGYRIVYDPAAVSRHRHRQSWSDLRHTIQGYGVGVYAMWTGHVLERGDVAVARQALRWATRVQIPALVKAVFRRPGAAPLDLVLAELKGCLQGPFAWMASRRRSARAGA